MKRLKRIQFEISDEAVKSIEQLKEQANITTTRELFNNALTLLEWAVKEVSEGKEISSFDEKEEKIKTLEMPILSNVRKRKEFASLI